MTQNQFGVLCRKITRINIYMYNGFPLRNVAKVGWLVLLFVGAKISAPMQGYSSHFRGWRIIFPFSRQNGFITQRVGCAIERKVDRCLPSASLFGISGLIDWFSRFGGAVAFQIWRLQKHLQSCVSLRISVTFFYWRFNK